MDNSSKVRTDYISKLSVLHDEADDEFVFGDKKLEAMRSSEFQTKRVALK